MNAADSPAACSAVVGFRHVEQAGMAGRKRRRRAHSRRRWEEAAELYLEDCFARRRPVSVKEFAASYLESTQPYVSRSARQVIGTTIRNYLRSRQLAHAQALLRTMPRSVTILHIALASGFGTPWTFTRCFRKAFGTTPGTWRAHLGQRAKRRSR